MRRRGILAPAWKTSERGMTVISISMRAQRQTRRMHCVPPLPEPLLPHHRGFLLPVTPLGLFPFPTNLTHERGIFISPLQFPPRAASRVEKSPRKYSAPLQKGAWFSAVIDASEPLSSFDTDAGAAAKSSKLNICHVDWRNNLRSVVSVCFLPHLFSIVVFFLAPALESDGSSAKLWSAPLFIQVGELPSIITTPDIWSV